MKESIYTIPVNEAFAQPCECPICTLRNRFEKERVDYYLGPSLMEPENRIETNKTGFCAEHFTMMYNTQTNRLGLGLILDTYMAEQNKLFGKIMGSSAATDDGSKKSLFARKPSNELKAAESIIEYIDKHEKECCICQALDYTMNRYAEVILQLFFSEKEFRERFDNGMGFCLPHFKWLINLGKNKLSGNKQSDFLKSVMTQQLANMERIEKEVDWFTKKFDYRNNDAPWGNSRDSVVRGIKKMTGAKEVGK